MKLSSSLLVTLCSSVLSSQLVLGQDTLAPSEAMMMMSNTSEANMTVTYMPSGTESPSEAYLIAEETSAPTEVQSVMATEAGTKDFVVEEVNANLDTTLGEGNATDVATPPPSEEAVMTQAMATQAMPTEPVVTESMASMAPTLADTTTDTTWSTFSPSVLDMFNQTMTTNETMTTNGTEAPSEAEAIGADAGNATGVLGNPTPGPTFDPSTCVTALDNDDAKCGEYLQGTTATCDCYNFCSGKLIGCIPFGQRSSFSCSGETVAGCTASQRVAVTSDARAVALSAVVAIAAWLV